MARMLVGKGRMEGTDSMKIGEISSALGKGGRNGRQRADGVEQLESARKCEAQSGRWKRQNSGPRVIVIRRLEGIHSGSLAEDVGRFDHRRSSGGSHELRAKEAHRGRETLRRYPERLTLSRRNN